MSSLLRDLPAQRLEETWRAVVCAAARTAGRAWVVGCGGHLLYRVVVHHVLPLLLRRLRAGLRRHVPPASHSFTTSSAASDTSRETSTTTSTTSQQQLELREDEETDGPVPPPRPAADGSSETCEKNAWAMRGLTSRSRAGWLFGWLSDTEQNRESLRLGAFLACMTSSFRLIEFALERLRGRDDGWNAFVAGAVSGLSIAFDSQARQKAVSLYVFFKACGMAWSLFVVPRLPAVAAVTAGGRWSVGQHLMWCVLCGVMMYSFFCEGELLDSFVYRFLYTCTSPHDQYAMSYVRKHALGLGDEDPEAKAQQRRDFAQGKLRTVPPPVIVKQREHFASRAPTLLRQASRSRSNERAE